MNIITLSSRTGRSAAYLAQLVEVSTSLFAPRPLSTEEWQLYCSKWLRLPNPLLVSVGYMYKIPAFVHARIPTVNLHPGKLPDLAGKDPHLQALNKGLTETAVTLHWVTDRIDQGPKILEVPVKIFPDDTPETLELRLKRVGVLALASWLLGRGAENGKLQRMHLSWD